MHNGRKGSFVWISASAVARAAIVGLRDILDGRDEALEEEVKRVMSPRKRSFLFFEWESAPLCSTREEAIDYLKHDREWFPTYFEIESKWDRQYGVLSTLYWAADMAVSSGPKSALALTMADFDDLKGYLDPKYFRSPVTPKPDLNAAE